MTTKTKTLISFPAINHNNQSTEVKHQHARLQKITKSVQNFTVQNTTREDPL